MFSNLQLTHQLGVVFLSFLIVACSDSNNDVEQSTFISQSSEPFVLEVYKNPTCGCCGKWITHIEENGFEAIKHNRNDLSDFKIEKGIQPPYQSCHTAISEEGYVFEGHVPARYIQQFLEERPADAIGLSVPAMPVGSPGMEVGDRFSPYELLLLKTDGSVETYARINSQQEQY